MSEEDEKEYNARPEQHAKSKSNKSVCAGLSKRTDQLAGRIEQNKEFESMKKQSDKLVHALDKLKSVLDQKETKK